MQFRNDGWRALTRTIRQQEAMDSIKYDVQSERRTGANHSRTRRAILQFGATAPIAQTTVTNGRASY
jgi:hypothetical protein